MSSSRKLVRDIFLLYGRLFITAGISIYTTRLIVVNFGVKDYGVLSLITSGIALFSFGSSALSASVQRFLSFSIGRSDFQAARNIFTKSIFLSSAFAILFLAVVFVFQVEIQDAIFSFDQPTREKFRVLFISVVLSAAVLIINIPYDALLFSKADFGAYSFSTLIESILKLVSILILSRLSVSDIGIYAFCLFLISFLVFLVKATYCRKIYPESRLQSIFGRSESEEIGIVKYTSWSMLSSASNVAANQGQILVLNKFFDHEIIASQALTAQLSGQLGVFSVAMLKTVVPFIEKAAGSKNIKSIEMALYLGGKFGIFLLAVMYIPFLVNINFLLEKWLGVVPSHLTWFLPLLMLRNIIEQCGLIPASIIGAFGNIKSYQLYLSIAAILPIPVAYFVFAVRDNPVYIYWIFIVFSMSNLIAVLTISSSTFTYSIANYVFEVFFKSILSLGCMASIIYYFNDVALSGWSSVLLTSICAFFIVCLVFYMFNLSRQERTVVNEYFATLKVRLVVAIRRNCE